MPLTPGTKLGPYAIHSALGAGGMGEVYRANDTRLDRTVAIKVLPSHLSHNGELNASSAKPVRFPALRIRTSARSTMSDSRTGLITS